MPDWLPFVPWTAAVCLLAAVIMAVVLGRQLTDSRGVRPPLGERYRKWLIIMLPLLLGVALYSPIELTRYIFRYMAATGQSPREYATPAILVGELVLIWLPWPALVSLPFILPRLLERQKRGGPDA